MEIIEREMSRLKLLLGDLQEHSIVEDHDPIEVDSDRSAFNFASHRRATHARPTLPDPVMLEAIARYRRKRIEHFGPGLFADPAWDMIIDLAIARARFVRVSVTSLCIASGVPPTTALRWIGLLIERGIFQREDDVSDKRRAFISLTDGGIRRVANYFNEVHVSGLVVI